MSHVTVPRGVHGETVLLVEDGRAVRAAARFILERVGFVVLEAATAEQADALLRDHPAPIHLLLTDLQMPGLTGQELAARCRRYRPETAIVLMSGAIPTPLPGPHFLQKPFTPQMLQAVLRAALEAQELEAPSPESDSP